MFDNTFSIAGVKAPRGRGGVIENVVYRDCTLVNTSTEHHDCQYFRGAIYVDYFYGVAEVDPHKPQPRDDGTPVMRRLRFGNITLETVGGNAIYLGGLPESPLEDVRFENVKATGKHGFVARNVRGLVPNNVSGQREQRARDGVHRRGISKMIAEPLAESSGALRYLGPPAAGRETPVEFEESPFEDVAAVFEKLGELTGIPMPSSGPIGFAVTRRPNNHRGPSRSSLTPTCHRQAPPRPLFPKEDVCPISR